jgi:hypothetical protein
VDNDVAAKSTQLLRDDSNPVWARLRELLRARGLDPDRVALADFFPDDTDMEFGIVVTPDGHVYEFDFIYGKGDLATQAGTATISEWRDRSTWWRDTPHRARIEQAFRLLADQDACADSGAARVSSPVVGTGAGWIVMSVAKSPGRRLLEAPSHISRLRSCSVNLSSSLAPNTSRRLGTVLASRRISGRPRTRT